MTRQPSGAPVEQGAAAEAPVYVISVAAELTGLHPQTLRTYDRLGLVTPGRTGGGGRRYSCAGSGSMVRGSTGTCTSSR